MTTHSRFHGGHSHSVEFFKPSSSSSKQEPKNPDVEWCKNLTWTGAAVNLLYCGLKISLGTAGGSVALVADGLHAVVDVASDAVAIGSLYLARMPKLSKRCQFPFGTGRAETVGAVLIAITLILGAFSVAWAAIGKLFDHAATPLKQLRRMTGMKVPSLEENDDECKSCSSSHSHHNHDHGSHHHDHDHSSLLGMFSHDHSFEVIGKEGTIIWSMLFVASSSIIVKELLYRLMLRAGNKAGSASTIANAYHHRADALSAALGLGGVVSSAYGLEILDAVAGLGVAAVILQLGFRTLKGSTLQFFDYQGGDLKDIRNLARGTSNKGAAVNVFATRHGLQVVLHGTLLMKKEATCEDVAFLESLILEKVTTKYPNVLFDVFFKVRPYNTQKIVVMTHEEHELKSNQKKKSSESIINDDDHDDVSDLVADLDAAIGEVAQFHGIEVDKSIERRDDVNELRIKSSDLGSDCVKDLERCAALFDYKVVNEHAGKNDDIGHHHHHGHDHDGGCC